MVCKELQKETLLRIYLVRHGDALFHLVHANYILEELIFRRVSASFEFGLGMDSRMFRVETVLIFSIPVLAALCMVVLTTDAISPSVELEVLNVGALQRLRNGDDRVALTLNIKADLESVFTWNTKQIFVFVAAEYWSPEEEFHQISLWDTVVEKKENAKINQQIKSKLLRKATRIGYFTYPFQAKGLRGRDFNLTMYWEVMPNAGVLLMDKFVVPGFQLPNSYA